MFIYILRIYICASPCTQQRRLIRLTDLVFLLLAGGGEGREEREEAGGRVKFETPPRRRDGYFWIRVVTKINLSFSFSLANPARANTAGFPGKPLWR